MLTTLSVLQNAGNNIVLVLQFANGIKFHYKLFGVFFIVRFLSLLLPGNSMLSCHWKALPAINIVKSFFAFIFCLNVLTACFQTFLFPDLQLRHDVENNIAYVPWIWYKNSVACTFKDYYKARELVWKPLGRTLWPLEIII